MHELSIAEQILPAVLKETAQYGQARISEVHLLLGEMMLIVPHALEEALKALSEETSAKKAYWRFTEVPTEMRCNICNQEFHPEMGNYICPGCGNADSEIIAGKDILIDSIELETEGASQ